MEDFYDWGDCGGMSAISGGVPIPRSSQVGSIHHTPSNILTRPHVTATSTSSNSIPASSASPFVNSQNSPFNNVLQSNSPQNFQYSGGGGNSPAPPLQQFLPNDPITMSPMSPNSPSPSMWQAQSMDLENDLDIKIEPLDDMMSDHLMTNTFKDPGGNSLDDLFLFSPSPQANDEMTAGIIDNFNIISDFSNDATTCLDPQHSSPAAMTAVNPDDVMGRHPSSYGAQPSSSFGFSSLNINSPPQTLPIMEQQQAPPPSIIQQSQSFTSTSLLSEQLLRTHNNALPSTFMSNNTNNGTIVSAHGKTNQNSLSFIKIDPEAVSQGCTQPMLSTSLKDPSLLFSNSQPTRQNQTNQMMQNTFSNSNLSDSDLFQMLNQQQQQQSNAMDVNTVMAPDNQRTIQQQQGMKQLQQQGLLLQQQQQQQQQQQLQQLPTTLGEMFKIGNNSSNSNKLFNQKIHGQQHHSTLQQQLQRRQHLMQQQSSAPMQVQSKFLQSIPATPNNTPISASFSAASPTLRDMLQSPATSANTMSSSPRSPHSCSSPLAAVSPQPAINPQSPAAILPHNTDDHLPFLPLGGQNSSHQSSPQQHHHNQQHSPQYLSFGPSTSSSTSLSGGRLSSSAPAHTFLDQMMWARREPRKHLISTGSLAEEQNMLSPVGHDESCLDSDEDSDNDNFDSESDNDTQLIVDTNNKRNNNAGAGASSSGSSSKKERHFWQYNVQAKGPKGQRVSLEQLLEDPHQLLTVSDPVFSTDCGVQGIKHSGKARRGDGNDLNPNPAKLVSIGKQLNILNKMIMDMTPVSEQPSHVRPKSRKEKNKLASRACRLKKKAQHEANKIKLYGLGEEHKTLLNNVKECRALLLRKVQLGATGSLATQRNLTENIESVVSNKPIAIAGQTAEFINGVITKCKKGQSNGGLDGLGSCIDFNMPLEEGDDDPDSPLDTEFLNFTDD